MKYADDSTTGTIPKIIGGRQSFKKANNNSTTYLFS